MSVIFLYSDCVLSTTWIYLAAPCGNVLIPILILLQYQVFKIKMLQLILLVGVVFSLIFKLLIHFKILGHVQLIIIIISSTSDERFLLTSNITMPSPSPQ